jgi:erythritol kinase (D-erythritol 1-phosphate-forming)
LKRDILIGIDAGTSVIKSVAFTRVGEQLAVAALPNSYVTLPNAGVEQDMARTWTDTAKTLAALGEMVPDLGERLIAIAVTAQGDGTWLIDAGGAPAAPAWLWLDARAADIAEEFMASTAYAAHYARTGTGVNACQQSTHLVWMKRHAPDTIARAASAHHCKDWLYFKLTGARVTDPSESNYTFGGYRDRAYQPDVLDALGASELKRLLPPIVEGTTASHALNAEAAKLSNLPAGIPVVLGYLDVICTGLGGGLFDTTGRVGCTILGSTGMHMKLAPSADAVKLNAERSGYTMVFPVPGMSAQMQSNMAATLNIDWLLDIAIDVCKGQGIERARKDILAGMDDAILASQPGRILFHPYISSAGERGPFLEPAARATFTGLEVGQNFADLMRGVFEGLCHAARDCYEAMGAMPSEIRLTGGAARSKAMRLLLASALKADVRTVSREEAGAAGAAMMAAVQQKLYPDMAACAKAWVNPLIGPATEPDKALAATFDKTFPLYVEVRKALRPVWRGHHAMKREALHAA